MTQNTEADFLKDAEKVAERITVLAEKNNRSIFRKYPLTFSFFSLLGFAAVLYGLERTFDRILFFQNNPWVVLLAGVIILMITGTLYKWFQNKSVSLR